MEYVLWVERTHLSECCNNMENAFVKCLKAVHHIFLYYTPSPIPFAPWASMEMCIIQVDIFIFGKPSSLLTDTSDVVVVRFYHTSRLTMTKVYILILPLTSRQRNS